VEEAGRATGPARVGWREIVAALLFVGIGGAGGADADDLAVVLGVAFAVWLFVAALVVPRRP
jgi:hypothetical protein